MSLADYQMDRLFIPSKASFVARHSDFLILCLVASVGLVGSLYVFASRSIDLPVGATVQNMATAPVPDTRMAPALADQDDFDKLVVMSGDRHPGSTLTFTLQADAKASRYYLDMGNKERIVFTQPTIIYTYPEAGKYTIELKVLKNRLLQTVAKKSVRIK